MTQPDELIDSHAAAALIGIKKGTLETWRSLGKGPRFIKYGNTQRAGVRYQRSEVLAWIAQQTFRSTSAYTVAAQNPKAIRGPWETPKPASSGSGQAS